MIAQASGIAFGFGVNLSQPKNFWFFDWKFSVPSFILRMEFGIIPDLTISMLNVLQ